MDENFSTFDMNKNYIISEKLLENKTELINILKSFPDLIIIVDNKGKIIGWKGLKDLLYVEPKKLLNKYFNEICKDKSGIEIYEGIKKAVATNETQIIDYELNIKKQKKFFESKIKKIENNKVLIIIREITDRVVCEKKRFEQQKREAISILAGGAAHELRNALSGILGVVDLLSFSDPKNEVYKKYKNTILQSSERITTLTDKLLAYSKGGKYISATINLQKLVTKIINEKQRKNNNKLHIVFEKPKKDFYVFGDVTQIELVFYSIIKNSIKARRKNVSKIEITLNSCLGESENKKNKFVEVKITDNGRGMNGEVVEKIFDPFFTTGNLGRGLSMAAVYGIVKNHDGEIFINSKKGEGTTVIVRLPIKDIDNNLAKKILIVEDEKPLLDMYTLFLKKEGYLIVDVLDGESAIKVLEENSELDLIIIDSRLPGLSGIEVYKYVKKINKEIKILFISGDIDLINNRFLNNCSFLLKPFSLDVLKNKVKDVLNR